MADNQDDRGAMSEAGMLELAYHDTVIKDMLCQYTYDTGYPYPTTVSLGELDAVSCADEACAQFLDASRSPSSFIYDLGSLDQAKSPVMDENPERREAHDPLPKKRSKCDNCGASFARRSDLRRHAIAQHSPQFIYKCTFNGCTKAFHRKDKFQDHVRRVHESEASPSVEDVVQRAIHQYLYDTKSLDLTPESHVSKGTTIGQSFWTLLDVQMRQLLNKDPTSSTTTTGYNNKQSKDFNANINDFSKNGNVLSPSTSSNRTISSKDPKEVHSLHLAGEIDHAKVGLACPYRKHNPVDYNIHVHTTCAKSSWDTVTRIKEHLIRHHRAPFQCPRCWTCFSTEADVSIHFRSINRCEPRPKSPADGMTPDVERRIRSRKRRDQSEAKKWEEIYTILFPEQKEIPSPYFVPIGDDAAAATKDRLSPLPTTLWFPSRGPNAQIQLPSAVAPPPPQPAATTASARRWATSATSTSTSTTSSSLSSSPSWRDGFPRLFRSRLEVSLARQGAPRLDEAQKSQVFDIVAECWAEMLPVIAAAVECVDQRVRDLDCGFDNNKEEGGEEGFGTPAVGYTLVPALESIVDNNNNNNNNHHHHHHQPGLDEDLASYWVVDSEMDSSI